MSFNLAATDQLPSETEEKKCQDKIATLLIRKNDLENSITRI